MYQQALELNPLYAGAKEIAALYQDIIALHCQQGSLASALTFGEQVLAMLDPSLALHVEVLADVTFQLGLLCSQTHHHRKAIRYAQLAFQYMQQLRVKRPERMDLPQTVAFLGRTSVNIGTGYGGTANSLSLYATTLAYWRCGEALLSQVGAEDVAVPQDNIAGLKSSCLQQIGGRAFEQLWQASNPLYQEIQVWLSSPDTVPGPLLTALMAAACSSSPKKSQNARDKEQ
jgi:tetratricopeptide (TPR) repeat protein